MAARRTRPRICACGSVPGMRWRSCRSRAAPPLFVIATGSALLVSLTLPEQLEAGHVDFARQLAGQAWAYAVAVERRYRGLPPLPDTPVPYMLTARGRGPAGCRTGAGGPGAAARRAGGDGMTATSATVRFGADGVTKVESFVRLTGQHLHPLLHLRRRRADPDHPGRHGRTSRSPSPAGTR